MNILGHTKVLGVFGHPVAHSLSPLMHNAAIEALNIDYVYVPFHVLPEHLETAVQGVRALNVAGVNLTIPHKERVIEFLDEVSESAANIGSVNTVVNRDGRLLGESTDGPGFLKSIEAQWGKIDGSRVLMLGAGGSAKAVAFALVRAGCELVVANRTAGRAAKLVESVSAAFSGGVTRTVGLQREELGEEVGKADLLVNTTSVGMHPDEDSIPLPPDLLRPGLLVYDLVYSPLRTRLIEEAESRGARAANGLGMLVHQGALSFEMWTGRQAPVDVMERAIRSELNVES